VLILGIVIVYIVVQQNVDFRRLQGAVNEGRKSEKINQCLVQANKSIKARHAELVDSQYPLFTSIVIAPVNEKEKEDLRYFIFFNFEYISKNLFRNNKTRAEELMRGSIFFCNNDEGQRIETGDPGDPYPVVMALQCPLNPNLKTVSFHKADSKELIVSYDVSQHVSCVNHSPYPVPNTPVKYAATAFVFGDIGRKYLLPWIEYNRLIGFDHFFIFLREEYDDSLSQYFPHKDYITYIPYDLIPEDDSFLQEMANTQAIYMARGFTHDIQWLAIMDPDEYIRIVDTQDCPRYHAKWLAKHHEKEISIILDPLENSDIGAVQIKNWDYGRGPQAEDSDEGKQILLDYSWRAKGPVKNRRAKCIVRPFKNHYYGVHFATLAEGPRLTLDPYCEAYFAHIKIRGLHFYNIHGEEFEYDPSLQKKYRELVAANMDGISEAFVVN